MNLEQIRAAAAARKAATERKAGASRNPDGTYGQPPEGAYIDSGTGQMIDPAQQQAVDERMISNRPVMARLGEFVQGAPFVGEWMDEAIGTVDPTTADRIRKTSDAMERQRPGQSMALNVAGGVAGTAAALSAAPSVAAGGAGFVGRGANVLTRGLRAGLLAAPAGAIEGASSFAGRAEEGGRGRAAGLGAVAGGGLALALGPVAAMTGEGVTALARRIKKLDVKAIAQEFGVSGDAARVVKQALLNDDLNAASARLAALGDDAMLADAGPATGALLDASASTGGAALRTAREAVEGRATTVGQRLTGTLDGIFGKSIGVKTAAREIAQSTSPARQAAYKAAYSQPIDYAGAGRGVEEVLTRVPPRIMRQAFESANEMMQAEGVRNMQIMAQIADDGSVRFVEMPNVQQLDYLKRALGDIGAEAVDNFGRPTNTARMARNLASDLRDAIVDAVPQYKTALRLGQDKIATDEGLALGKDLLFRKTSVEDVKAFFAKTPPNAAKQAVRQGVRESIESTLSNVRRTITDPNTDAREAMQLVKEMSSRANIAKIRMVLGPSRAEKLLRELDKTAAALELRAAIAQNSKTAIRQSIGGQVQEEITPNIIQRTAGNMGNPLDAAKELTRTIAGVDPRTMGAREKAIFDEIATALVGIQGKAADRALVAVSRALAGQPIKDADAKLIGRLVGGSIGQSLYESSTQRLQPQ